MPRIRTIRYVNLGHENARMEDLTLDMTAADGRPTETAIWLDNGGGKSSMLSLFFSMVRPSANDFLGKRSEQGIRRLDDYVLPGDHSIVAVEWEMDRTAGDLFGEPLRLVTGVFLERSAGEEKLKRTYFSFRVFPAQPGFTIDTLPVYEDAPEKKRRWTRAGFQSQLNIMRERLPQANVFYDENQGVWANHLDASGLDTNLFAYQIRMNQREGGASELFKFRNVTEFVNFFMEVVLGEEAGAPIASALGTFRDKLRNRRQHLLPERDLVEGLLNRFQGMTQIANQRKLLADKAADAKGVLTGLREAIQTGMGARRADASAARREAAEGLKRAHDLERQANERDARLVVVKYHYAYKVHREAEANDWDAQDEYDRVATEGSIAKLGLPLSRALRFRQEADELGRQLDAARSEHAPLRKMLEEAAAAFVGALKFRIERGETEARDKIDQAETLEDSAAAMREESREFERMAQEADAQVRALEAEDNLAREGRERLQAQGATEMGQSPSSALARLRGFLSDLGVERVALDDRKQALTSRSEDFEEQALLHERDATRWNREADALSNVLETARREREELEADQLLLEALRKSEIDLDVSNDDFLHTLGQVAERERTQLFYLWREKAQAELVLRKLDETGLLPPSQDVETVLEVLVPRLKMAVSGWEYASKNFPLASGEAPRFIQRAPHLATGVIVRDDEYETARELLVSASLKLDAPLVVAPQKAAHDGAIPEGFIVSPASDAFFDAAAGERERISRRESIGSLAQRIEAQALRLKALESRRHRLADFWSRYPQGWFRNETDRLANIREMAEQSAGFADEARTALAELRSEMRRIETQLEEIRVSSAHAERSIVRLDEYLARFGEREDERAEERRKAATMAREAQVSADQTRENTVATERLARSRRDEAAELRREGAAHEARRTQVRYADQARVEVRDGDLEALFERYESLRAQYHNEVNESGIEQMRQRVLKDMRQAEARYEAAVATIRTNAETRGTMNLRELSNDELLGEVRAWVSATPNPDEIEERRNQLASQESSARAMLANTSKALRQAKEEMERAAAERDRLTDIPSVELGHNGIPESVPLLPGWVSRESKEIAVWRADVAELERVSDLKERVAERADHEAKRLEGLGERLDDKAKSFAGLLARAEGVGALPPGWVVPQGEEELSARITDLQKDLDTIRAEDEALDERRDELHADIIHFIAEERFEGVAAGHHMVRNLKSRTAAYCESDAPTLVDQLGLRLRALEETIAAVDEHRRMLVGTVLAAAEKGVQELEAAQRLSRMPAHMPRFGGKRFLKISYKDPGGEQERQHRIANLIDDITGKDDIPSGLQILQQAVIALVRENLKIEVLFPDQQRGAWYTLIEKLGKDSGGELLTSAILLYCNLARLRARHRGQLAGGTSPLLLDNPFGIASKLSFLEAQLEVARAAGVQLIYTTGVKDYDAVSLFPNINRVRPAGLDQRTRQWLLERAEVLRPSEGMDGARMVRRAAEAATTSLVPA